MAEQVASLFVAIGANLAGLNEGLSQAQGKLKTVGDRMAGIGKTLTTAVTLPLIGIGVASVKMAGDFEEQMGLAQLALRDTGVSMDTVSDYALKMGADTIFNAQEMALALTGLGKAGLSWEEIAGDMSGATGVLAAVTNLAAASDLELAQAADTVAVAMATFGRPAEDAVAIVDNLVMSADASVAEVGDLAAAFATAGPVIAGFGWSMEDMSVALALLSERGIRGSEAGTALRSMMNNLMRPTDQVKDALAALNVNLYDSEGRLKVLPAIIGELSAALAIGAAQSSKMSALTAEETKELDRLQKKHESIRNSISDYQMGLKGAAWSEEKRSEKVAEMRAALGNLEQTMAPLLAISQQYVTVTQEMTEEQRNQLIQTIAGFRGMLAMNTLLEEGTEGWEGMTEAVGEGATAQEVANIKMGSLKGRLEELKGSVETLAIKFGGTLSPTIKTFVDERLIPLTDALGELDEEQMAGLAKLGLIIASIGPGLFILGKLPVLLAALTSPLSLVAIGASLLASAWYMSTDEGIKFRTALRGLSSEFKKTEGLEALGEWIDRLTDFLDALDRLGLKIQIVKSWFAGLPSVVGEVEAEVYGPPYDEKAAEKLKKDWKGFKDFFAGITEWGKGFFGTEEAAGKIEGILKPPGWEFMEFESPEAYREHLEQQLGEAIELPFELPMILKLSEEAIPSAVTEVEMLEDILTEKPIALPLTVQPDMGQIEASGRRAGSIWKRAFDSATGGTVGGNLIGGEGSIMGELQAAGVAW